MSVEMDGSTRWEYAEHRVAGTHRTLAALFDSARPELLRLALRVVKNQADAEDVVQTSFARAVESSARLPANTNWRAWLGTVVQRAAIDSLRRARVRQQSDTDPGSLPASAVEPTSHWRCVDNRELQLALAACSPALRTTFELRFEHGLSYKQIAQRLDLPVRTVATRLSRARARLRRSLDAMLVSAMRAGATAHESRYLLDANCL